MYPKDPSIVDDPDQLRDISRREGVKCCITKRRKSLDSDKDLDDGSKTYLLIDLLSFSNPKSLPKIKKAILEYAAKDHHSDLDRSDRSDLS